MAEVGELRNCPFCDEALEIRNSGNPYGRHHKGSECIIAAMAINIPGDVERWNRRAPDPERDELREALRPFAEVAEKIALDHPGWDHDDFMLKIGSEPNRLGPYRRAARLLQVKG